MSDQPLPRDNRITATQFLAELSKHTGIARQKVLKERRARETDAIVAVQLGANFGTVDSTPRVDAPRFSVKRAKPAPYVNHQARYRRLRRETVHQP